MTLQKVKEILNAVVLSGDNLLNQEVKKAFGADLMSDLLSTSCEGALLLTGLVNVQVIRTAEILDVVCIVFVRGKCPGDDVLRLAAQKNIVLMKTDLNMYDACGLLYLNGLR
ncbi:hypothetical protein SAMN02746089_00871 [Caldanaerobius fijiensis DSM 17918]|uniref:DRTGG domain-containing protein n=1 Tax=Caldanaerobius fijiensis DSM 17918 TaxID=1121256 RepID=A0A1M4WPX6_9THEO|nr:hypothetical protein SAMN02746089_00871 [Caldanaerobius fijiensis DSM 17918]